MFAETGATIDVSGTTGALLPMSANEIQVNVQGNELRDSPDNRDSGVLANANVWIDVRDLILVPAGTGGYATDRYYTPGGLLEVSGYLSNTGHTIGEWTVDRRHHHAVGAGSGRAAGLDLQHLRRLGQLCRRQHLLHQFARLPTAASTASMMRRPDMTFIGLAGSFTRTHKSRRADRRQTDRGLEQPVRQGRDQRPATKRATPSAATPVADPVDPDLGFRGQTSSPASLPANARPQYGPPASPTATS